VSERRDVLKNLFREVKEALSSEAGGAALQIGRYEIVREVARGGAGVVYEATDPDLRRRVAVKVLRDWGAASPVQVERLRREAAAAAKLKHPNIVSIHEIGLAGDAPFIAMDFVEGKTLADVMPSLNRRERLETLKVLADAVAFAHDQGVVHRDLKPQNVLLEPATRGVFLTDFGLAKVAGAEELTRTGTVLGTPQYMAPEQARGDARRTGPWTDVWSLGAMLYEMLTLRKPFDAATAFEVCSLIMAAEPRPPRKADRTVHPELETICLKALEKDPEKRYPTAREFADDLGRYLRDEPIRARPVGPLTRFVKRVRRQPAGWALGGAAAVLLALAAVQVSGARERERLRKQTEEERHKVLAAMRQNAALFLEAALAMRRSGNPKGMRLFLAPLQAAYEEASARAPDLAEVDYLMGRMYRALMQESKALEHQERALSKDPSFAPARYDRGLLLTNKYRAKMDQLRDDWRRRKEDGARPGRTRLEDDEARELKRRVEEDLGGLPAKVAQGVLNWVRGDRDRAKALFEEAAQETPDLEEPYEWLGEFARQEKSLDRALGWYSRGHARDKGYLPFLQGLGLAWFEEGNRLHAQGKEGGEPLANAVAWLERALEVDPDHEENRFRCGRARVLRAISLAREGSDASELFRHGVQDLERALRLSPSREDILARLGQARLDWAAYREGRGEDALPLYRQALQELEEALRQNPDLERRLAPSLERCHQKVRPP
jgi:tetratricopeptide (TPR) repeat protein